MWKIDDTGEKVVRYSGYVMLTCMRNVFKRYQLMYIEKITAQDWACKKY